MIGLTLAHGVEERPTRLVLQDPRPGIRPILNVLQHLPHGGPGLFGDDLGATGVIAMLGRVADRVAHVAQPALLDQVHDELHLVQALEVGNLRLVASLDQRLKASLDEGRRAAT